MNDLQRLQALYQAYRNGQIKFSEYAPQARQLVGNISASGDLGAMTQATAYDPYQVHQAEQAKSQAQLQGLAGVGTELFKTGIAADQINTAKRGLNGLTAPGIPAPPGYNQQLTEQLYQAQRRANDVGYAVNPAVQQINQAYNQAVQEAAANSGGQQSNYQANANLANYQRMQAALGIVPLAQQARIQNQGVVNDLMGLRMQEQQNMFQNQLYGTQLAQDQYNRAAQAYGQLGAAGGYNMINTVSQLPQYLQYLPFDDNTNKYMQDTHQQTESAIQGGLRPSYQLQNYPSPSVNVTGNPGYSMPGYYGTNVQLRGPIFNPIKKP